MTNNQLDLSLFIIEHLESLNGSEIITEFGSMELDTDKQNAYMKFVRSTVQDIIDNFDNKFTTKLSCMEVQMSENNQSIMVTICGGLNGCGEFSKYLETLRNVISAMESAFQHVWLVNLVNDTADDVFYLKLSVVPYINPEIEN